MRCVVQRVTHASVTVDEELISEIGAGYLVLVGVEDGDTEADMIYCADKIAGLRVFEDENDKMNLALPAVNGEILSISQFTLYADAAKGNRPSFAKAGKPEHAERLYLYFNEYLRSLGFKVEEGIFGAYMQVRLLNDGPVTILLDSEEMYG